ncbi:hypothetical protein F4679DRAFT_588557 [Xylaria curta]|nr:hypothetical protein F4679DRAFT_588557 [Xylaria curta]
MDSRPSKTATVDLTMDTDRIKSPFDPLPGRPGVNRPAGTDLDPIVLDDDDSERMAQELSPKKRKHESRSTPSCKRRLISIINNGNNEITPPRLFTEILDSEDEDNNMSLRNEVATLRAEVSRLKTTLRGVQSDLSRTQIQEKNLSAENVKLLKKIDSFSNHQKSPEGKLRSVRLENA